MKLLAIETATEMCSVALWRDNVFVEQAERAAQGHSDLVLSMVEDVLRVSDTTLSTCDALAYGTGPGSFTALRIGVGVVQGIALGAGLPVIGISSLCALAQRYTSHPADGVLTAFDARMGEVYWCCFERDRNGNMVPVTSAQVGPAKTIQLPDDRRWLLAGSGIDAYEGVLKEKYARFAITCIEAAFPRAAEVAQLASMSHTRQTVAAQAHPKYVRQHVAEPQNKTRKEN